jgi:hypothetical protein
LQGRAAMASEEGVARRAPPFIDPPGYSRHRPEETLLYQLVEEHYPAFAAEREAGGRPLPQHVREEFEAYLKCGRLEHGFLRVRFPNDRSCGRLVTAIAMEISEEWVAGSNLSQYGGRRRIVSPPKDRGNCRNGVALSPRHGGRHGDLRGVGHRPNLSQHGGRS